MRLKKVVFLPNWVGDFLMAFASLDCAFEKEPFLLFGYPKLFELIRGKYHVGFWIEKGSWGSSLWRLFRSSAVEAVLLPNSFSSALMATLAGMKTIGLDTDARGFLLNRRLRVDKTLHQAEIYRRILEEAGLKVPERLTGRLYLDERDVEWARGFVRSLGWKERGFAALHVGASKPQRCWPVESFEEVARRLIDAGVPVAVVGSASEAEDAEVIGEDLPNNMFVNVAKLNLSLGKLAAFISLAKLFVGNDSGPLHMAAASGVDCVGIYGTSVPEKTGPVLAKDVRFIPVSSRYPCAPCRERFFEECDPVNGKPPCIAAIGVGDVWQAVEALL